MRTLYLVGLGVFYLFCLGVLGALVWLLETYPKHPLVYALFWLILLWSLVWIGGWIRTIVGTARMFGVLRPEQHDAVWSLNSKAVSPVMPHNSFLGITGILLAILSVAFGLNSWVLALYLISVFLSHTAELMRPPLVLLLAQSRIDPSVVYSVTRAASPHRVVSLLEVQGISLERSRARQDSIRGPDDEDWLQRVCEAASLAKIVILDSRSKTGPIMREVEALLRADQTHKCLFIVESSGESPVLDEMGTALGDHPRLARIKEADLSRFVRYMASSSSRWPSVEAPMEAHLAAFEQAEQAKGDRTSQVQLTPPG